MRLRHPSVDFAEQDSQSLLSTQSSTWNGASRASTAASVVRPPESQISSRFQEFRVSPAYVKTLTKDKCALCKMYFARETVRYKVPMHRIHELHQRWAKNSQNKNDTNNNGTNDNNDDNDDNKRDQALSVALTGRRYQSPSFLYTTVRVCTFCSQLFMLLPDELPTESSAHTAHTAGTAGSSTDAPSEPHKTRSSSDAPKLSLTTQLARTNLALSRTTRTYQSSVVDNKLASYAVLPPYELCARTRREVDPWWEIDLGRTIHAHSLSFKVRINVRQAIHVVVALLKAPVGFENPFLDRIRESALLVKEFAFAPQDDSRTESVSWELPPHTLCFAVRVQLRGIQTLSLSQFVVFQGDDYVPENKADFETLSRSFAALPVSVVKEGLKEMLSSSLAASASAPALFNDSTRPRTSTTIGSAVANNNKKNKNSPFKASLTSSDGLNNNSTVALRVNTTAGGSRPRTQTHAERVSSLAAQAREQYISLSLWTERALQAVREIHEEEVQALYKVVFKYAADLNPLNAAAQHTHAPLSPPLSPHSSHNTHNNVTGVLNEHDLLSPHALTQHTPRCELRELHNRLRSVLRWLQTRTHSKTLGGLLHSERLLFIAENTADETLAHFAHAIARVERYWSLCEKEEREREEQEKREREIHAQRASLAQSLSLSLTSLMSPAERERERERHTQTHRLTPKTADRKGCSWTQFLILMDCFCRNECDLIPSRVFDIASDDASISGSLSLTQTQPYTLTLNERDDDLASQSSLRLTTAAEDSPRRRRTSSYALNSRESTRNTTNVPLNNATINNTTQANRRTSCFLTSDNNNNNNDNQSESGSGIHYVITTSVRNVMRRNASPFARGGEDSLFSNTYGSDDNHKKKETSFLSGVNKSPVMFFMEQQEALKSKRKTLQQEVRESGFNPFDSTYSEFKFDRFKRRTALHDMDFPKELSLEFAATLIPKKATTSAGASLSHTHNGGLRLGGELEQSVLSSDMIAHSHSDDRSAHSGNTDPLLAEYTGMPLPSSRPTLSRANTRQNLSRSKSGRDLLSSSGYFSIKSTATVLAPIMNNNNKTPFVAAVRSSPSKKAGKTARFREEANESFDDFDFDDDFDENNGNDGEQSKQMKNINFFRVCSLCELRLPRASVEYKVLRKHIVKLRCAWDPKLVSKEVHSLDNSITMYNLVNVCVFCAQFFDPDFPDGIAYPVRIPGTNKSQASDEISSSQELIPLSAISSQAQDKPLVPFYDTRYLANDIDAGDVLTRPSTTQARQRAKKVIEIAREVERRKNKDMSPSTSSPSSEKPRK